MKEVNRIACTMCHGVRADDAEKPVIPNWTALTRSSFERKVKILSEMGAQSIGYAHLEQWRNGDELHGPCVMIDFDHAVRSIFDHCLPILSSRGLKGNVFVDTDRVDREAEKPKSERGTMTWDELGKLAEAGWTIGAHTVHHYSLAELEAKDPTGAETLEEMSGADDRIKAELGITPRDFAYTGTGWSSLAEKIASQQYRFARLWIIHGDYTDPQGNHIPVGHLLTPAGQTPAPNEQDGGPPHNLRYITRDTNPYRLPSMELEYLIAEDEDFRRYIGGQ